MDRSLPGFPALVLLLILASPALAAAQAAPELAFHYPQEMAALAERLERYERDAVRQTMKLVGLEEAGGPIPVFLAREGSGAARRAPSWSLAYAQGGQVVLIPSRVPAYPYRSIETVLHHEVTHVLIGRAAGGRSVPRWFHEGLALYAARDWGGIEDRSRLLWATFRRRESTLESLDAYFAGGADSAARAYAFSSAFVRFLIDRHGAGAPARILAERAAGASFEEAFSRATGTSLGEAEERFFHHLDLWNKWVPFLTSSTTLWLAISLLALYAFKKRRERDAAMRALWEAEETAWGEEEPGPWIN